ncbi:unnamed protein product [Ixodes persulcatus]
MGCICSFVRALTSYHGSHLTPKQVELQRKQRLLRARGQPPSRSSSTHTQEAPPLAFGKDRTPSFGSQRLPAGVVPGSAPEDVSMGDRKLGSFGGPPGPPTAPRSSGVRLADQGRQSSFSRALPSAFHAASER